MGSAISRGLVLGVGLAIDVGIQVAGWAAACALKSEKFYDALGSVSFLALALGSLACAAGQFPRQIVMTSLVCAWTLRLGSFLVLRVLRTGGDSRFDELKTKPRARQRSLSLVFPPALSIRAAADSYTARHAPPPSRPPSPAPLHPCPLQ
jgi:steroid 5-alpha reductase family enzyme